MTTDIYAKRDTAFWGISAYALVSTKTGGHIGTVSFKRMKHSGVVHCYFHLFGAECSHGKAEGYGYDKMTASVETAIKKLKLINNKSKSLGMTDLGEPLSERQIELNDTIAQLKGVFKVNGTCLDWNDVLLHQSDIRALRGI